MSEQKNKSKPTRSVVVVVEEGVPEPALTHERILETAAGGVGSCAEAGEETAHGAEKIAPRARQACAAAAVEGLGIGAGSREGVVGNGKSREGKGEEAERDLKWNFETEEAAVQGSDRLALVKTAKRAVI